MKIDHLNNTLSVLARVTGVRMEDATVQIGKFNFTIGQLTDGVPSAGGLASNPRTPKAVRRRGSKNRVVNAAKTAKRSRRNASSASVNSGEKRSVGKPVSPEGMRRRELIIDALEGAAGPMALAACVQAVLPGMEKFIVGNGGKWSDNVSTTQNQLIRYDLKKMADRGILTKNGDGRETTFRVRAA
jgi:hypothetical protein